MEKDTIPCTHAAAGGKPPLGVDRAHEIARSLSQEARSTLLWCIKVADAKDGRGYFHRHNHSYQKLHDLELIWSPFILPATRYRPMPESGPTSWGREVAALFVSLKDMDDERLADAAKSPTSEIDRTLINAEIVRRQVPA